MEDKEDTKVRKMSVEDSGYDPPSEKVSKEGSCLSIGIPSAKSNVDITWLIQV